MVVIINIGAIFHNEVGDVMVFASKCVVGY